MQPRRVFRGDDNRNDSSEQLFPILASETVRSSSTPNHQPPAVQKGGEEKISIFWRIFGGTILSISALVVISAYQSHASSIQELRTALAHANEARAELVKKDEYASSRTKIWDRMQEIQKEIGNTSTPIDQMKHRLEKLETENRTLLSERKETHELHATLKERLAQMEQQVIQSKLTQKDVQVVQQTLFGMQEKSTVRDQQLKQTEDERKELVKEIQALRERLAKVEAAREARPAPAKPTGAPKTPARPMDDDSPER